MRTASLILITTLFSATSMAAPSDWKTTLDILSESVQSEIKLIGERIANLEKGDPLNQATVNGFTQAHRNFYETHCRLGNLNPKCAKWAQASTSRDLTGVRAILNVHELRDRLTQLSRVQDFIRYARVFQRPEQKLEDTLTWKPVRDVPTVVSPGQFIIKKPATIVEIQPASGAQGSAQTLPGS